MPTSPMSVLLPDELRTRLERQAKHRGLKVSTALRVLLDERLKDLESREALSDAEEWQRAQAWGTYERHQRGDVGEASWDELEGVFDRALAGTGSESPSNSVKTSKRRSRGS